MPIELTDDQVCRLMGVSDFVDSCDQAFKLYGAGELRNLTREEALERDGNVDVFRLELAGDWGGVLQGRKVIVERSDVSTGRLGDRSARIELSLTQSGERVEIDAELITNRRTGAAAALGARYLGPERPSIIGVIGSGRIAESSTLALDHLLGPERILITSRRAETRERLAERLQPDTKADLLAVQSVEEAVSDSDVVVTTVPTPEPILTNDVLKEGAHLSVIAGDPRTVQLDLEILLERPVVVDDLKQAYDSGDFLRYAEDRDRVPFVRFGGRIATIGDAALGLLDEVRGQGVVTYFTGMAIQDLHAAYAALMKRPTG